jgi:hypothetical protein
MDEKIFKKTTALLYWYIFGVPICLILFAYLLTLVDFPVLIGFSFLLIVMYAGMVGILTVFTNATIAALKKQKNE